MSVMTEARMEAKAQKPSCNFVSIPVYIFINKHQDCYFAGKSQNFYLNCFAYHPGGSFHIRSLVVVFLFQAIEEIIN